MEDARRDTSSQPETAMRKLKLDVDQLEVEAFDTGAGGAGGRGTVRGHYPTGYDCPFTYASPVDCNVPVETQTNVLDVCVCSQTGPKQLTCDECYTQWEACEV